MQAFPVMTEISPAEELRALQDSLDIADHGLYYPPSPKQLGRVMAALSSVFDKSFVRSENRETRLDVLAFLCGYDRDLFLSASQFTGEGVGALISWFYGAHEMDVDLSTVPVREAAVAACHFAYEEVCGHPYSPPPDSTPSDLHSSEAS